MSKKPILQAVGITKAYGRVIALDGSDLELFPGEVLAVVGDNGAGKSTMIKCLSGAEIPDHGQIIVDGQEVSFKRPQDGRHAGIETVYQTLAVAPALDIAANLFLGREMRKKGPLGSVFRMIDSSGMRKAAKEHIAALGIGTIQNIAQAVETLSGGQRQAVAVARAAAFGQKVIILDEPTAALGVAQTEQVLNLVRRLADNGLAVVLISHNLNDVFEVADNIAALYLGNMAAQVNKNEVIPRQVIELITTGKSAGVDAPTANSGVKK
jgi:fructose transport system ATP-binding protein